MYGSGRLGTLDPDATGALKPENMSFEVTDHLGNVKVVIGDYKVKTSTGFFESPILAAYDYYAFA